MKRKQTYINNNQNKHDKIFRLFQSSKEAMKENRFSDAAKYLKKSMVMCEQLGLQELYEEISGKYASVLLDQGRYVRALKYLNIALKSKTIKKDEKKYGSILNSIGNAHFYLRQFQQALIYFEKIIAFCEKVNDDLYTGALCNAANTLKRLGKKKKALEYYKRALIIVKKKNDRSSVSMIYNSIGGLYLKFENPEKSLINY